MATTMMREVDRPAGRVRDPGSPDSEAVDGTPVPDFVALDDAAGGNVEGVGESAVDEGITEGAGVDEGALTGIMELIELLG